MFVLKTMALMLRPFRSVVGSGLGNKSLLKGVYKWFVSTVIPEQSVVVETNGYKLNMAIGGHNGMDALAAGLLFGNGYEVGTTKLFNSVVKEGMNVVDVGAHIGYYTVLSSKLVGDKCKVWAFEPEPRNYQALLHNLELNNIKNVQVFNGALGDKTGKGQLYLTKQLPGEATLFDIKSRPDTTVDVEVAKMDDVLIGERVDVIKVDVEGGEVGVLKGAKQIIESNPQVKLFTEVLEVGLDSAGYSCHEYWVLLREYGFAYIYLVDEKEELIRLVEYDDMMEYMDRLDGCNLLCSKEEVDIPFQGLIPQKEMGQFPYRVGKRVRTFASVMKRGDFVLDVGCGIGEYTEGLLKHLPIHIVGIDSDLASIEYARSKNGAKNVEFVAADGATYSSDKKFDVIICSQVLEHLKTPSLMLENFHNLLKDDGILCLGVPNGYGCYEVENVIPRMIYMNKLGKKIINTLVSKKPKDSLNVESPHVSFFTVRAIKVLIKETGWVVDMFTNEELLGGVITDRTVLRFKLFAKWDSKIAEGLFPSLVNGWIITCKKDRSWQPDGLKAEVKRFWDATPCGTSKVNQTEGTRGFYEALSERRYRLEPFIDRISEFEKWKGKKVLEVGCGVGCDLARFAESGADITGIDLSAKSVELAKRRLGLYGLKGKALEADAEILPFEDSSFDMVYSYGVLHHTHHPELAIKEIHRVLKQNGEIRVVLYNKHSLLALEMWVLFGLLEGKLFRNVSEILWNHHESIGTKAYTIKEMVGLFNQFKDVSVMPLKSLHDIRCGRSKYLPSWSMKLLPSSMAWLIAIKGRK